MQNFFCSPLFELNAEEMDKYAFFWTDTELEEGKWLSLWNKDYPFTQGKYVFETMLQYLAFEKARYFKDEEMARVFVYTLDPFKVFQLQDTIKNPENLDWSIKEAEFMKEGFRQKFEQNPTLKRKLLLTKSVDLTHFCGIGAAKAVMELRSEIPKEDFL